MSFCQNESFTAYDEQCNTFLSKQSSETKYHKSLKMIIEVTVESGPIHEREPSHSPSK